MLQARAGLHLCCVSVALGPPCLSTNVAVIGAHMKTKRFIIVLAIAMAAMLLVALTILWTQEVVVHRDGLEDTIQGSPK